MRFIPSFVHGFLDYLFGFTLAVSPWLLGFPEAATATLIAVILGLGTILYSLLTNYELGVLRLIPFPVHLIIDCVAGLFLLVTPWLFGFSSLTTGPFVTFGIVEIGVAVLTLPHVKGFGRLTHTRY